MQANDDILNLLREQGADAAKRAQRGLILQPGAIGDCILTVPLAKFIKDSLNLGGLDILGHTEYLDILPGRTCVDSIRSMDAMDLHRLFTDSKKFDLADGDPLINAFAEYTWIVTFLGEPNSNFEQNLIYTANCSHSAEVITLTMKPPKKFARHLTDFYIQQFIEQSGLSLKPREVKSDEALINPTEEDKKIGKELLKEIDVDSSKKPVIIQPGSGGENKCWHMDNFLAIAKKIGSNDKEAIFLLGPAESNRFNKTTTRKIGGVAKCLANLSLTQTLGLLSCADCYVGNDSGITHLAAALGVQTTAVFGPTEPAVYGPVGPAVTVVSTKSKAFAKRPSPHLQKKLFKFLMS